MKELSLDYALATIPESDGGFHLHKQEYNTNDIIRLMLDVDDDSVDEVAEFAKAIPATRKGLEMLYDFLIENIRYKRDPANSQFIRSPARMLADRDKGSDCKTWSHFITRVLRAKGLDYDYNFTSYRKLRPTPYHVYPTAILPSGEQVHMDAVWGLSGGSFGLEKPFAHKIRYKVRNGLAYLSGTQDENILQAVANIERSIPDNVLENSVLHMTEGQLQRYLMQQRMLIAAGQAGEDVAARNKFLSAARAIQQGSLSEVSGLGELSNPVASFLTDTETLTSPAFRLPTVRFTTSDGVTGVLDVAKGVLKIGKKVGGAVVDKAKDVAAAIKNALEKLLNWLFKGALQKAAPFFIFQFIKNPKGTIKARFDKQLKVLGFIQKLTGAKASNIRATLKNGIIKYMGAEPEKLLNARQKGIAGAEIGAIPAIVAALPIVIEAIGKVASIFKKEKEMPSVGEGDASDLELIKPVASTDDIPAPSESGDGGATANDGDEKKEGDKAGGFNPLLLGGLAAAALLIFR